MEVNSLYDPYAIHFDTFAGDVYTLSTASITLAAGTLTAVTITDGTLSISSGSITSGVAATFSGLGTFGSLVVDTTTLVVDAVTHKVEIGSADGSDKIQIYHDNSHAHFNWDDGVLFLQTTETNTHGIVQVRGNGIGQGILQVHDEDTAEYVYITCAAGVGQLLIGGTAPSRLAFQSGADIPITMFEDATAGKTKELNIYGYRNGDVSRSLQIGVGVDADDTASFDGLSNYLFNGSITVADSLAGPLEILQLANTVGSGAGPAVIFNVKTLADSSGQMGAIVFKRIGTYATAGTSISSMEFYTANNNVDVLALTIDEAQRVGIGTATPGYILDIDAGEIGDNNYDGLRIIDTGWKATSHPMLEFYNSNAQFGGGGTLARIYGEIGSLGENSKLYFAVADSSKNLQDRMVIDKDGNVGIGTTTPSSKLSINGGLQVGDGTNETQISSTGDLVFVNTAGLPYGECHQTDGATFNVTMTTINVWVEVDAATTNINAVDLNLVTFPDDHYLLCTKEGRYFITYSFTAEIDSVAGGDQHIESGIMINGSIQTDRGLGHEQYAATNKERNLQGHTIIDIPTNGQVSLALKNTASSGKILTIDHLNITVTQVGGT